MWEEGGRGERTKPPAGLAGTVVEIVDSLSEALNTMPTATQTKTAQVTCVRISENRSGGHEAISHLGGDGWLLTRAEVIAYIEAKTWDFYTKSEGKTAWLYVRTNASGGKFVQTQSDGVWSNNLLNLGRC